MSTENLSLIVDLLAEALSPESPAATREKACDRLKMIPGHMLRSFAASPNGKEVLTALSPSEAARKAAAPTIIGELPTYAYDIATLINDDWGSKILVPQELITRSASPRERLRTCAAPAPIFEVEQKSHIRRLPGSLLNHASALIAREEIWTRDPVLLGEFWDECLNGSPHLGTPWRLAQTLEEMLTPIEHRKEWFNRASHSLEEALSGFDFPFAEPDHLAEIHFSLRSRMAGWIRRAEITSPDLISALEIYTACFLIRHSSQQDLRNAWEDSGRDITRATLLWKDRNMEGDLLGIKSVESLFSQASADTVAGISRYDQQALAFVRQMCSTGNLSGTNGLFGSQDS